MIRRYGCSLSVHKGRTFRPFRLASAVRGLFAILRTAPKRNHFFRLRFLNLNLVLITLIPFTISTIWYFSRYCALFIPILSACLGLSVTVSAVYREPLPISAPPFNLFNSHNKRLRTFLKNCYISTILFFLLGV